MKGCGSMGLRVGPDAWLESASVDLRAGRACLSVPNPIVTAATYHCQQAAEKLVKAVLVWLNLDVPRSHDIDALVMRIPRDLPMRPILSTLGRFTAFATLYRYPGEAGDVSDEPTTAEVLGWLDEIESTLHSVSLFLSAGTGSPP
ncbi:HEPN domain-containing protein [Azospirillum oryzae]|nr:HEPN domain-containing protein [Azospirillum oryzae]